MRLERPLDVRPFPSHQSRLLLQLFHPRARARRSSRLLWSSASAPAPASTTTTTTTPFVPESSIRREFRQRQAFHERFIPLNLRQAFSLVFGQLFHHLSSRRRLRPSRSKWIKMEMTVRRRFIDSRKSSSSPVPRRARVRSRILVLRRSRTRIARASAFLPSVVLSKKIQKMTNSSL